MTLEILFEVETIIASCQRNQRINNEATIETKVCLKKIGIWHIFVCSSLCIHAM